MIADSVAVVQQRKYRELKQQQSSFRFAIIHHCARPKTVHWSVLDCRLGHSRLMRGPPASPNAITPCFNPALVLGVTGARTVVPGLDLPLAHPPPRAPIVGLAAIVRAYSKDSVCLCNIRFIHRRSFPKRKVGPWNPVPCLRPLLCISHARCCIAR